MKPNQSVLVVEDCVVNSLRVNRLMEQALPGCRIMRAQSCFEARLLLRLYEFDLCVLDVHLPDGCGLDLIPRVSGQVSVPQFIVVSGDTQPDLQDRTRRCGVTHFLTKPFATQELQEAVKTLQAGSPGAAGADGPSRFSASLDQVCLLDVLQLKCLNAATTRLEIRGPGPEPLRGVLDLDSGEIVHAELRSPSAGTIREGEQALVEFLPWSGGAIVETGLPEGVRHTIDKRWQPLLLSIAQEVDETAAALAPERN